MLWLIALKLGLRAGCIVHRISFRLSPIIDIYTGIVKKNYWPCRFLIPVNPQKHGGVHKNQPATAEYQGQPMRRAFRTATNRREYRRPPPYRHQPCLLQKVCRLRSRSYIFPQLYRNLTYIAVLGPFRIRTLGCCRLRRSSLLLRSRPLRSRLRQIRRGRRTRPRGRKTRYRRPGHHGRPGVCSR
jgi:hypothetical protein